MARSVTVEVEGDVAPLARKARELMAREIGKRSGLEARAGGDAEFRVLLAVRAGVGPEGFRIEDAADGAVRIAGNDARGLLYGAGRFLRGSRFDQGAFRPGGWRGSSAPAREVRGIYFATHFHNFYHEAPVAEVARYVEELALWGCNALSVWFDMHHFQGIDDPEARRMIGRLKAILRAARDVGMATGLTTLANEGFADSPADLRADWTAGHDGYTSPPGAHYHVEVCPSRPGGLDYILRVRREVLDAFSDVGVDYLWLWPYDQGGCTCRACAPWGANGFLRAGKAVADLVRRLSPATRIILSTWYFDHFTDGEWEGLAAAFRNGPPDWVDYLLADDFGGFPDYPLRNSAPGGLPMVGFPEISMEDMHPWGGFGANPRPSHWQAYADATRDVLAGSFPYSEGIFEDINKTIALQLNWDPGRSTRDVVREYAAYEFSPDVADEVAGAVEMMEASQCHSIDEGFRALWRTGGAAAALRMPDTVLYSLPRVERSERCRDALCAAEAKLSRRARKCWRWRVLMLRAELDVELHASCGRATDRAEECFDELSAIYHADKAQMSLQPPGRGAMLRRLGLG